MVIDVSAMFVDTTIFLIPLGGTSNIAFCSVVDREPCRGYTRVFSCRGSRELREREKKSTKLQTIIQTSYFEVGKYTKSYEDQSKIIPRSHRISKTLEAIFCIPSTGKTNFITGEHNNKDQI